MSELSIYESRPGKLSCNTDVAFAFITDLRNFGRFVREGTVTNWTAEKESCSFNVSMMGSVALRIQEKEEGKKVVYQGDALSKNDFTIRVELSEDNTGTAEARLVLSAILNPMMKMMAEKPIKQFMEKLIEEMEEFRGWSDINR